MHFATLRGGISAHYEPVDLPLTELKAACSRKGISFGKIQEQPAADFVYCDIGETVLIDGQQGAIQEKANIHPLAR